MIDVVLIFFENLLLTREFSSEDKRSLEVSKRTLSLTLYSSLLHKRVSSSLHKKERQEEIPLSGGVVGFSIWSFPSPLVEIYILLSRDH